MGDADRAALMVDSDEKLKSMVRVFGRVFERRKLKYNVGRKEEGVKRRPARKIN